MLEFEGHLQELSKHVEKLAERSVKRGNISVPDCPSEEDLEPLIRDPLPDARVVKW
jgi:hypothetical protein